MAPPILAPAVITPLDRSHDRAAFRCGVEPLDRYLATQAAQDMRKLVAVTYVLAGATRTEVAGYYTLASTSVPVHDVPASVAKGLPRYPVLPATLLGRLAVAEARHGQGLGELLLMDALRRSLEHAGIIGAMAVVTHAKDEAAARFYRRYDFQPFPASPFHLFLPMAVVRSLFSG